MGGLFGMASKEDCTNDLFFGTDYHSHLGTRRGGLAVLNPEGFVRFIHNIENAQFRSKFEQDITRMHGNRGIGVISDYENQPLIIRSHLGNYAIATVGVIKNADRIVVKAFNNRKIHFTEMMGEEINQTELAAALINQESTFEPCIDCEMPCIKKCPANAFNKEEQIIERPNSYVMKKCYDYQQNNLKTFEDSQFSVLWGQECIKNCKYYA